MKMTLGKGLTVLALIALLNGCGRETPPISTASEAGLMLNLPAGWIETAQPPADGMTVRVFQRGKHTLIRAVVMPAVDVPFAQQVEQDRNNLNVRKDYKILLEKDTDIHGGPAYIFIVTSVEKGDRYKSKIVMIRREGWLVYLTLQAEQSYYEDAVPAFNAMLDGLIPSAGPAGTQPQAAR